MRKLEYPTVEKVIASSEIEASERPPKHWWDEMEKEVKKGNPSYSKDQVDKTIGDIWYNKLTDAKRKELRSKD